MTVSDDKLFGDELGDLVDDISRDGFSEWRRREDFRDNIEDGHPEYNRGGYPVENERHSPHTVLQCPRKQWYRDHTAPEETDAPAGIFTVGTYLEEEIVEPFLAEKAKEHDLYLQNSIWIEVDIPLMDNTLKLRGSTDPVFCDNEGVPQLVTEVKSKYTGAGVDKPLSHHVGQLTCYQFALARTYDISAPPGLIIYLGRKDLQLRRFPQPYDTGVLGDVINWMEGMTDCRIEDVLPPADPVADWDECYTCAFKERCGKGDEPWENVREHGFLPLVSYPRSEVITYLRVHPESEVTPTIAAEYPDLAETSGVYDWVCEACGTQYTFGEFDWDGDRDARPTCPNCSQTTGTLVELRGPAPDAQLSG